MNKCILLLICISNICFGLDESYFKERYQSLDEVLQVARQYRLQALPTQQREELLNVLFQSLPSYNSTTNLDEAIEQFVKEQFQNDLSPYHIVPIANTSLAGNSEDPVYFVMDDHDRLQLIVKAFTEPQTLKGKFLKEISSLDFIHTHPSMPVGAPYPLAIGKVELQETHYGLLAQSPAKGLRFDALIHNYKNAQGDQASTAFNQLIEAFHTASQAIAQLNHSQEQVTGKITQKMINKMHKHLEEIQNGPAGSMIAQEIPLDTLQTFVEKLISDTKDIEFIKGYSHFSAHLANVFFDPDTAQISYIDDAKMFDSYNCYGAPLSFSTLDAVRFIDSFRKVGCECMSFDEMCLLTDMFKNEFCVASEDPHVHTLLTFLEVDSSLGRLVSYHDFSKNSKTVKIFETAKQVLIQLMKQNREQQIGSSKIQQFLQDGPD